MSANGGGGGGNDRPSWCDEGFTGEYNQSWHIAAIFIVLVTSLVGTMLPILGKRVRCLSVGPFVYVVGKSIATGVVISVALIHMLQPADEALTSRCISESFRYSYEPYSYMFCLVAAIMMHFVDVIADMVLRRHLAGDGGDDGGDVYHHHSVDKLATDDHLNTLSVPLAHGHSHLGSVETKHTSRVQRVVAAMLMEISVTLHSVFVGLTVGVADDTELMTLLAAICFHQFFEGVALGSRLAEAQFHLSTEFLYAIIFTISAPIGVAAGVAAISTSGINMNGETYLMTQGIMDALCAGVLLYLGFGLLFNDFTVDLRNHCSGRGALKNMMMMFTGLWVGAGVMAYIGKYL